MGSVWNEKVKVNRYGKKRNRIKDALKLKCNRDPGSLIRRDDRYSLDQISENEVWFYHKSEYIMKNYGLTIKQYYNLCMYGHPYIVPICPYCGRELQFRSLEYGYYPVCSSKSCKSKYRSENTVFNDKNFRMNQGIRMTEYNNNIKWKGTTSEDRREMTKNWSGSGRKTYSSITNSKISRKRRVRSDIQNLVNVLIGDDLYGEYRNWRTSRSAIITFTRDNFLSKGEPDDPCVFYIAVLSNGRFKFGVSSNELERMRLGNYKNIKVLLRSTRLKVAYLEYSIKIELNVCKEDLSWNEVHMFRKAYNKFIDQFKN